MGSLINSAGNTLKIAKETTFGSPVTPIEALKHTGIDVQVNYETVESKSFTGSRASNGSFTVGKTGSITWPFEADLRNLGWLMKAALGSEVVAPAGTAYKHTFSMLDSPELPSLTMETSLGGVFHYTNKGCVLNTLNLEVSPKAIVSGNAEFIYVDQDVQASPTALIPVATKPYTYNDSIAGSVKIDGVEFGEMKSLKFTIGNNISQDDFRLGLAGVLASLPAGIHKFSGSATIAFNSTSAPLEEKLASSTAFALAFVVDTGILLDTGITQKFEINIPVCQISNIKKDTGDFIYMSLDFASVGDGAEVIVYNDRALVY